MHERIVIHEGLKPSPCSSSLLNSHFSENMGMPIIMIFAMPNQHYVTISCDSLSLFFIPVAVPLLKVCVCDWGCTK